MKKILITWLLLSGMLTFSQTPAEVYKFCKKVGVQHVDIVMKQVILETGWLKCTQCSLDHNNIFGFRWKKKYLEFPHWGRSVYYMIAWQHRHYTGGDYYEFLIEVGYATDSSYIDKVKSINIDELKKEIDMKETKYFGYFIEEDGRLFSTKSNRYLKPSKNGRGYPRYVLGKQTALIHRLLAEAFIPNPNNLPCVNHKDGNKENYVLSNLEWCTYSENSKHGAFITGSRNKAVIATNDKGEEYSFHSIGAAAEFVNGFQSNISKALKGTISTAYGYKWKLAT